MRKIENIKFIEKVETIKMSKKAWLIHLGIVSYLVIELTKYSKC